MEGSQSGSFCPPCSWSRSPAGHKSTMFFKYFFRDEIQDSPLHKAARFNPSADVSMALIAAGEDVNSLVHHNLQTPLHLACFFNQGIVNALLEAGAWVNILNNREQSPLFLAAWKDHRVAVSSLLAHGADIQLGTSPLCFSSISPGMKSFLIQNKSK